MLPLLRHLPQPLLKSAFIAAVLVVFALTMMPLPEMTQVVSSQDKFEHAIAFLVLMLLGSGGWPGRIGRIAVGLSAYGLFIEICQHTLTTNRFGDPWDWVADSVGVLLGWLLVRHAAPEDVASA
ncbi:hypothetical protein [Zoogloea sp.]|uniref:hypothetical protein n=1 Tax=Zoogloea sp. TaxID=49181 RepID=UPI0032208805